MNPSTTTLPPGAVDVVRTLVSIDHHLAWIDGLARGAAMAVLLVALAALVLWPRRRT